MNYVSVFGELNNLYQHVMVYAVICEEDTVLKIVDARVPTDKSYQIEY